MKKYIFYYFIKQYICLIREMIMKMTFKCKVSQGKRKTFTKHKSIEIESERYSAEKLYILIVLGTILVWG